MTGALLLTASVLFIAASVTTSLLAAYMAGVCVGIALCREFGDDLGLRGTGTPGGGRTRQDGESVGGRRSSATVVSTGATAAGGGGVDARR